MSKPLFGSNVIDHLAFVTEDVHNTALKWAKLLGKAVPKHFQTAPQPHSQVRYKGDLSDHQSMLIFLGTPKMAIELSQPPEAPSVVREVLNQRGEGFHHIGIFTLEPIPGLLDQADEEFEVTQTGEFYPDKGHYYFLDTTAKYKTHMELLYAEGSGEGGGPQGMAPENTEFEGKPLLGTDEIAQICFIVRDVKAARDAWCNMLGVEKPPILTWGDPAITQVKFRGQPTEARNEFCFINTPRIQIELVQPDPSSPSTWAEHLEKHGEGAHHIAFFVDNLDEKAALLDSMGFPIIQEGFFFDGSGKYAYIDTLSEYNIIIELLQFIKK